MDTDRRPRNLPIIGDSTVPRLVCPNAAHRYGDRLTASPESLGIRICRPALPFPRAQYTVSTGTLNE